LKYDYGAVKAHIASETIKTQSIYLLYLLKTTIYTIAKLFSIPGAVSMLEVSALKWLRECYGLESFIVLRERLCASQA